MTLHSPKSYKSISTQQISNPLVLYQKLNPLKTNLTHCVLIFSICISFYLVYQQHHEKVFSL